jgi:hypothetical protein
MKKWQQRFMAVAAALGFTEKVKSGSLTKEEQKAIFAEYQKQHNISFGDDRAANEDAETPEENLLSTEEVASLAALLNVPTAQAPQTAPQAVTALSQQNQQQQQTIQQLSQLPEVEAPVQTVAASPQRNMAIVLGHASHSATHLFGIEHETMARSAWWNQLMISRQSVGVVSPANRQSFMDSFHSRAMEISSRAQELQANNQVALLDFNKMIAGEAHIDYSSLTDIAGEYIVRRNDLILAYFRTLPSVGNIFPVVSNVQNKEEAPTATFGELSQGYREGRIFKGSVGFSAEVYSVVDVMFKYQFSDLIALEKKYIGYLNREGSSVIKWTFIEWIMVYFGQQLMNEQNVRRVIGVRVPQQSVTANPAVLAADGALRAIERVEEELKVLPFDDLAVYTSSNMLDYVKSIWDKVAAIVDNTAGLKVFANMKHKVWYQELWATKYGQYTGAIVSGQQLTDLHPENIIWIPNMPANNYKMFITIPGNVETYEDKPMEMLAFYFERDFESILTMSRWKEGSGVLQPGWKFATKAALVASERKMQWIFTNLPASALTLAATVSFAANNLFTISGSTADGQTDDGVTTVNGYNINTVYKLVAGSGFATTLLKKAGAFSKIASDFDPAAAGDYIKVYAELEDVDQTIDGKTVKVTQPTGKFLELSRSVTA